MAVGLWPEVEGLWTDAMDLVSERVRADSLGNAICRVIQAG